MERKYEFGCTTITCRKCQTSSNIERLEPVNQYQCPMCGQIMAARELALVKAAYYSRLARGLNNEPLKKLKRSFEFKIDLGPHFKKSGIVHEWLSNWGLW